MDKTSRYVSINPLQLELLTSMGENLELVFKVIDQQVATVQPALQLINQSLQGLKPFLESYQNMLKTVSVVNSQPFVQAFQTLHELQTLLKVTNLSQGFRAIQEARLGDFFPDSFDESSLEDTLIPSLKIIEDYDFSNNDEKLSDDYVDMISENLTQDKSRSLSADQWISLISLIISILLHIASQAPDPQLNVLIQQNQVIIHRLEQIEDRLE